jgi:predicted O-methyltransferase YrrM
MDNRLETVNWNGEYKCTRKWFVGSEINQLLLNNVSRFNKMDILEIGCYEGLSSVFLADNLLDHKDSTLTCVDPFMTIDTNDHKEFFANNEELNFDYNIKNCKNSDKIRVEKITSDSFFKTNIKTFDFIYIDGCHLCDFVTRDMENSFSVLKVNGLVKLTMNYEQSI